MRIIIFVLLTTVSIAVGWFSTKVYVETTAQNVARQMFVQIKNNIKPQTSTDFAIGVARKVHLLFLNSNATRNAPLLWRLRPYLTSNLLPEFARFKIGAIDAMYVEGVCDSAARTLAFILSSNQIPSQQMNMVNNSAGAHTVVLATLPSGNNIMLDPLYGVYPEYDEKVLSPEQAQAIINNNKNGADVWKTLSEKSSTKFYNLCFF